MAKHKAPTQVTIAPTEERSEFQEFVHRHWPKGAALAVVIAAAILTVQYMGEQRERARMESWGTLAGAMTLDSSFGAETPDADTLAELAEEHSGNITGPWARSMEIAKRLEDRDYYGAKEALDRLTADYPKHPLVRGTFRFEEDAPARTLADFLAERIGELQAWEQSRPDLFENPDLAGDAPRVRLNTSAGSFVVGLYADRAPAHADNFLKLCREGFYDGTRFHRVQKGFMVQGGDPNSKNADEPSAWGQGGPGYTIDPETQNGLYHFEGVLAAAKKPGEKESSGSQFYVTTGAPHHLDGQHTVFGKLLGGEDVVATIENAEIAEGDRPADPVVIESTEVL